MNALATHLLVEVRQADPVKLDDLAFIRESLISAAQEAGVTVLGDTFHRFAPQGVTGIVAIAESHISIHTWPEFRYAAVDVFTCGTAFQPQRAAELIIRRLGSRDPEIITVLRGNHSVNAD